MGRSQSCTPVCADATGSTRERQPTTLNGPSDDLTWRAAAGSFEYTALAAAPIRIEGSGEGRARQATWRRRVATRAPRPRINKTVATTAAPPELPPVSGRMTSLNTRVVDGTVTPADATDDDVATAVVGGVMMPKAAVVVVLAGAEEGGAAAHCTVASRGRLSVSYVVPFGRTACQCTITCMVTSPVAVIGSMTVLRPSTEWNPTGEPLAVIESMTMLQMSSGGICGAVGSPCVSDQLTLIPVEQNC